MRQSERERITRKKRKKDGAKGREGGRRLEQEVGRRAGRKGTRSLFVG